ncbi:MAG: DUF4058 family protein [Chroococcidiopsidaceae cyanobacterium CP_BM_RX_35]|nr:DUF4058 family protein [Chroococcidiopsidaceae cyanobacterium CP_BM_RX_35]
MKPKFPGMNPYLENPELSSEEHLKVDILS